MAPVATPDSQECLTRVRHEPASGRLEIAVDVAPADADDCTVAVGPNRVVIECDGVDAAYQRVLSPPSRHHVFDGKRRATYNNGVLTVSIETKRRTCSPYRRSYATVRRRFE